MLLKPDAQSFRPPLSDLASCRIYGEPVAVEKKPADQITHDDLRTLTDRVTMEIQKMSGQEYVNEYAQKVKEQLKAQKAAEQANS